MKKTLLEYDLTRTNYIDLYKKEGILSCINSGYFIESPGIEFNKKSYVKGISKGYSVIYTGAFCPFHEGHLRCIRKALAYTDFVIIVPDHDEYVFKKTGGYMNAAQRCAYISSVLSKENLEDRVLVDISFSCMESNALNFTTIQDFCILKYGKSFGILIGEDNISFGKVTNYIFCDRPLKSVSSTEIRNTGTKEKFIVNNQKKNLILRMSKSDIYPYFIEKYYNKVTPVYIEDQIDWLYKNYNTEDIISLDSMTVLKHNLRISRGYKLYGHQFLGYRLQSEFPFNLLNRKLEYVLLDDDIYTGNTISYAKNYLKSLNISVASKPLSYITRKDNTEVLDLRDLFAFGDNSGLYLADFHQRALYAYPFVDPYVRASVLNPLEFSYDVWKYNLELYQNNKFKYETVDKYTNQHELYQKLTDNLLISSIHDIVFYYLNLLENSYKANLPYL